MGFYPGPHTLIIPEITQEAEDIEYFKQNENQLQI